MVKASKLAFHEKIESWTHSADPGRCSTLLGAMICTSVAGNRLVRCFNLTTHGAPALLLPNHSSTCKFTFPAGGDVSCIDEADIDVMDGRSLFRDSFSCV
jgi:hypothetical protein